MYGRGERVFRRAVPAAHPSQVPVAVGRRLTAVRRPPRMKRSPCVRRAMWKNVTRRPGHRSGRVGEGDSSPHCRRAFLGSVAALVASGSAAQIACAAPLAPTAGDKDIGISDEVGRVFAC